MTIMKRLIVTVFALVMLAFGGMLWVSQHSTGVGAASNNPNNVIPSGVSSITDLRTKYAANKDNVQSAYSRMGITSDMVNKAAYKTGTIYKSGDIQVGGKVVATGAQTLGRDYIAGSTKVTPDNHVFYMRPTSISMASESLSVIVFLDANGKFTGAVINDCGNPVSATAVATPKPVTPKPTAPSFKCAALTVSPSADRTKFTMQATPQITGTAKLKTIAYKVKKDGNVIQTLSGSSTSPVNYTQSTAGDYTAEATITVVDNNVTYTSAVGGCTDKFTVQALPASYACAQIVVTGPTNRTQFAFTPKTTLANGAKFKSIVYTVRDSNNNVVFTSLAITNANAYNYNQTTAGKYTVAGETTFTVGTKDYVTKDVNCAGTFTVPAEAAVAQQCTGLSINQTGDRTQFTFTPTITPASATVKSVVYTVKDASGNVVGQPITRTDKAPAPYTQTTVGKYTVTAVVTTVVNGQDVVATGNCAGSFEVTAAPAMPTYKCEQLKATPVANEKGLVQFAVYAPADGGAKLSAVSVNYDDGVTEQVDASKLTNFAYTYAKNGTYNAQATVTFIVPEGTTTATKTVTCGAQAAVTNYCTIAGKETLSGGDASCKAAGATTPGQGSASTPAQPVQLVNTGVADIAGIFAAVAAAGALAYRFVWARGMHR